jgi:hypothetical protein
MFEKMIAQDKIGDLFKHPLISMLKKIAPSENIWGISCENSRFYAKKS